mgnify:CR=1 FL=1
MEPIINPWLIYLAGIADALKVLCVTSSVLLGGVTFVLLVEDVASYVKYAKFTGIAFILCVILAILIPQEKIVWMMIGASQLTPDNITAVQGNLVDFATQLAHAIK